MYRVRIQVSGKIPLSGKILPDNISVFDIVEIGVKTLERELMFDWFDEPRLHL